MLAHRIAHWLRDEEAVGVFGSCDVTVVVTKTPRDEPYLVRQVETRRYRRTRPVQA
jgi:hypothetical protein